MLNRVSRSVWLAGLLLPVLHAQTTPLQLSLKRAVEMAVSPEGSARIKIAGESVEQARTRSLQSRAALLPNIEGYVSFASQTRNLEALGLGTSSTPFASLIPRFVGPFNTFDARATAQQSVFDLASIQRYQASKRVVDAARAEQANTGDLVAAQVAKAYLAALKADADIEAVQANVELSKALVRLAENQRSAGTGTGLEVNRAGVQLANEMQRLLVAQNDRRRAQLQLLRAMGLPLETELQLTDRLGFVPVDTGVRDSATAFKERADLRAQQSREDSARLSASSVKYERLPSVGGYGDYGSIGTAIDNSLPTRTIGVRVNVPIFDGGRRDARRAESASTYRQEQVRTRDLRDQIQLEVQLAADQIDSAGEQVKVAKEGLGLAEQEFAQSRRRYEAGMSSSIEVTDAQTRLERARDNYTAALFAHNVARIDLALARGRVAEIY